MARSLLVGAAFIMASCAAPQEDQPATAARPTADNGASTGAAPGAPPNILLIVVDDLGYLGNRSLYRIRLGNGHIIQVSRQNQRRSAKRFFEWEDEVWVSWRPRSVVVIAGED